MNKLAKLKRGLASLEQILIHAIPLPILDEVTTIYALGKIELYNDYVWEMNDPERGLMEVIKYCKIYIDIYKGDE